MSEYLPEAAAFEDHGPCRWITSPLRWAGLGSSRFPCRMTAPTVRPAYWRRPWAYLDPVVRAGMSMLAQPGDEMLRPGLDRLAADLESGRWHNRHGDLLRREDFDAGYRLLITEQ